MKLWWALGVFLLLLLAAGVAAFVLLDEDRLRSAFESGLSEQLRMDVTIHGPVSLGLSPALNITGRQVGMEKDGRHVADIEVMRMHIAIPPLFRGDVEPRHFDLSGAGINIVRLEIGHFNFEDPDAEPRPDDQEVPSIDLSSSMVHFVDRVTGMEIEAFGCDGRLPRQLAEADAPGSGLARMEDTLELSCELVRGEGFELSNFAVTVHPSEDRIVVDPIILTMLEGEGRGHMEGEFVGDTPYWHLELTLEEFQLLAFLRTIGAEAEAEGTMTFEAELWAAGKTREGITQSLEGRAVVHGRTLRFHGEDLDDRLSDLEATQEFGLADFGAFLFAGPAGLLVTKGVDYAVLAGGNGASTEIRQVVAEWRVNDGVAHAEDVAMATAENRVAAFGRINLGAQRFEDFSFALLDGEGCAVFEQSISTFSIVARCERTGQIGVAASTALQAVGKLACHGIANVGAIASQALSGKQRYLDEMNGLIAGAAELLPTVFKQLPQDELLVRAVERHRERTAGIAFYEGPAADGSRPGIFYVNLHDLRQLPKFTMEALAYHEALPGHHMQFSIANRLRDLPTFRRYADYTAYVEGWGLYSELLAKELGLYGTPYADFGRLAQELKRACRLVVDTGIHALRWTRRQAIGYLQAQLPASLPQVVKEVERYVVYPGQATSYTVGMASILRLRKRARALLGEQFALADFHGELLRHGPLPLDLLEEQVMAWAHR